MLAIDEINHTHELSLQLRPEISLGNIDYLYKTDLVDRSYDGAAAARDIFLSEYLPQAVIIADVGAKALSAGLTLQDLGVPTVYTRERSSTLSHPGVFAETFRMTASEAQDGTVLRRLCRHYGWSRVGVVYSEDDFGVDTYFAFKHKKWTEI